MRSSRLIESAGGDFHSKARDPWTVTIEGHHEGYITWQEYLDNEAKLAANNIKRGARALAEGWHPPRP
jgi:hypothetical protein